MDVSEAQRRLLALCAIRVDQESVDWNLIAREAQFSDGLDSLWSGKIQEKSVAADRSRTTLRRGLKEADDLFARVDKELEKADSVGAHLVTVLDAEYPANLRLVPNLPPFLFVRGHLSDEDVRSVAVVGTRDASETGMQRAGRMAQLLAEGGVSVISGLARGIDTAAHRAALGVLGGRTIAVFGTGITQVYPSENKKLADEIVERGALVSQFWPTRSPGKDTFPRRNVVTSGLGQGTVVIEASRTSGAKMQARLALEHGKRVFLVKSLVTDQQWARDYVQQRGAIEVREVDEVIRYLATPERIKQATRQRQQLSLASL